MSTPLSKRLFAGMAAASLGLAVTACGGGDKAANVDYDDSVTVGILHSLTGTMAISESTLVDTEKMAIDEINAAGGVEVDGKKYKIEYIVEDGPDEYGDMFERPGRPADRFPNPFANPQQAAAANGGAIPPDFSVIVKARHGGPEYIRSLMLGYDYEVPEDVRIGPGQYYNPYMTGGVIAMPPQLQDGLVEYADGTEATKEQMATDVAAFLTWASEPHMEVRKKMGLMVMIYLLVLAGLLYAAYRQVWSNVKH